MLKRGAIFAPIFYATVLLLVLNQAFNRERWTWATVAKFLEMNGRTFAELVGILAGCGLLIGAFSLTGVVSSIANDMLRIAGNNAVLLLTMTAVTSLVLGWPAEAPRVVSVMSRSFAARSASRWKSS